MDGNTHATQRSTYWHDYRQWADTYDADVNGRMHYRGHIKVAEKITPFMRASSSRHVADLGTGTGLVLTLLRRDFPEAVLDGYDFSPFMLEKCRAKNVANTLVECDLTAAQWPRRPHSADFVTSSGLLDMINNTGNFLKNVRGILKPGGVAALTYEMRSVQKSGFLMKASNESRTRDEMETGARGAGFDIIDHDAFQGYVVNGRRFQYGVLTLHNPAP